MSSRRDILVGGALMAVSAAAFARMPDQRQPRLARNTLEKWVPDAIGPWRFASNEGVVLPTQDELQDRLYDNLVSRTYLAPGQPPVMLMLAYSSEQDGVLQIHRPEACYRAGGFALSATETSSLPIAAGQTIGANRFVASAPDRVEQVLYWTREGKGFPTSWLGQKRELLRANLNRQIPDGMLVRVSTLADEASSRTLMTTFAQDLVGAAPSRLRALLIGA